MATIQQGTTSGIVWERASWGFGPGGFSKTVVGVGLHAACEALLVSYQAAGWEGSCETIQGTPKSRFSATISTLDPTSPDSNLVTRWELDVQWSDVPAQNSKKYWAYLESLGAASTYVPRAVAIIAAADEMSAGTGSDLYTALAAGDKPWALDIALGETVKEPDAVLRRLNSYPPNTTKTADWVDVNKVFTTAQIGAITVPPSAIVGTLETGYWLKTSAGSSYTSDGRYEVATHWIWGRYPSHRYTYKT